MTLYKPNYYGKISGVAGVSVLGWVSDPSNKIVLVHLQGSSTAVRGLFGKARTGDTLTFVPEEGVYNIYGRTEVVINRVNTLIRYELFPKSPHVMPNGDIQQIMIRREDSKLLRSICYITDGDHDYQFMTTLKTITDYPLHDSWAGWLRHEGARKELWGVCNYEPLKYGVDRSVATLGNSLYGYQYRWMRNDAQSWESLIVEEGFNKHNISLPET